MINTARTSFGADDVEIDAILTEAAKPFVAADGTLSLPSKALVLRAVR